VLTLKKSAGKKGTQRVSLLKSGRGSAEQRPKKKKPMRQWSNTGKGARKRSPHFLKPRGGGEGSGVLLISGGKSPRWTETWRRKGRLNLSALQEEIPTFRGKRNYKARGKPWPMSRPEKEGPSPNGCSRKNRSRRGGASSPLFPKPFSSTIITRMQEKQN